jgi:sugar lactone lactonase YvrE
LFPSVKQDILKIFGRDILSKKSGKIDSGLWAGIVIIAAVAAGFCAVIFFDTTGQKGSGLPKDYVYDISQYAKIDPALILYRQVGETIATGLKSTKAVAVRGDIYVAGDKAIVVLDKTGKVKEKIALDSEPTCLAVDDKGLIAGLGKTIVVLDSQGKEQLRWAVPAANAILTSLAFNEDMVFAADAVNGRIYGYDRAGKLVGAFGQKGGSEDKNGFVIPSPYFDMAMASDGLLRVVDPGRHLIIAFTVKGEREWSWGKATAAIEGFCGCCNPVNFAIMPDGSFITVEKGLMRVKIYDAEGKFVGVVAGPQELDWQGPLQICLRPEQCQTKGFDVAVDQDGKIYILDTVKNVVRIFEKK